MNVICPSCHVSVDHASPGCAEHARREAENIHVAHLASDTGAEHCPVCTRSVAANRAERRQGMGAENDRLRAAHEEAIETLGEVARDLARAQDEIKAARATIEQHEARAREHSDERAGLCAELARVTSERDAAQWSAMATRQDIEQLARVVGRTSIELVLERVVDGRTVTQTPSAHVLADGRAYAPILGMSVPASPSLRDLIGAVEKAFDDGFKCTSTRPIGGTR